MGRGGGRNPSDPEDDRAVWAAVTATVRPLAKRDRVAARGAQDSGRETPSEAESGAAKPAAGQRRTSRPAAPPRPETPAKPAPQTPPLAAGEIRGVDRRTADRLRRGKLPVEGRLDLHGMSREAAHIALADYLAAAHGAGKRCVVVVTGKGRGILRDSVPHWLNMPPNRARVLAFDTCRPEHGGEGALYVLLKRRRDTADGR